MATKKGFFLLNNQIEIIEDLTDEQAGQLLKAFYDYNNGREVKLDGLMKNIFKGFKVVFDENEKSYQKRCETNKKNIEKYWEKIRQEQDTNVYERIQAYTMATKKREEKENEEKENKNNSERENIKRESFSSCDFVAPTLADIISYSETLNFKDKEYCEKFYNHYASIGWVNGTGQQIKNWKLVFNNWLKKDKKEVKEDIIEYKNGFKYVNGKRFL